ncbi:uncharacterized protein EI90DRAFT_674281 [Cantharellus anzutake]|uniref:uncharacterized protein n=1 Tax=Cantharellus anzutake TaxID=1750568 RepID=UPI001908F781|nr:uncharacterized protein EI90DRAFT_674281 [Cantharellus anzutake]KAF8332609.1 hypothetical protein EI90DRAFT_674281 [Cantharellus anzutake]
MKQEVERLRKLHPTVDDIPSCMKLLETFTHCNMLNSQIRALYRFGEMNDCKQKWEDVKFCWTLKAQTPEERRESWIQHRAEWWASRRVGRSSEDIWEIRTEPLQRSN